MAPQHKHLLNNPATLVVDSLKGLVNNNPNIKFDEGQRVIYTPPTKPRVALLSGGGSGHEPAHAGFVGQGLLDAAVCGNIFASPNVAQVRRGVSLVTGEKGALIVVMNYTGDALHFGLAAEQHKASGAPGDVRVLLVQDDVAVSREQGTIVGRRGLAGTILVYKIASALSDAGSDLDAVEDVAKYVTSRLGTIGVGLDHCHVPGTQPGDAHLKESQIELGMGIHNENGTHKLELPTIAELVDTMLFKITNTNDPERSYVPFKNDGSDEVVLLVNNLGAISELEIGGITGEATKWLQKKNIKVRRVLSGTYMTSLNMPGFSLTLLLLPSKSESGSPYSSAQILEYLDAPASAPGWAWTSGKEPGVVGEKVEEVVAEKKGKEVDLAPTDQKEFISAIQRACKALILAEPELTEQDQIAGDGDAGLTLEAGAKAVLKAIDTGKLKGENIIEDIGVIAETVEEDMGGTSGALYSIFFAGLGKALRDAANAGNKQTTPQVWSGAAESALTTLYKYTRARPPSRTLVDPLEAFITSLSSKGLNASAEDAKTAAEKTKELVAKAGRGAYVNQEDLKKREVPDPGAWGIWRIVDGLRGFEA
ncbi:dihydroxyacetone kinase [Kwoniella dejecticola CBS 10117]|uniref:Dihydroxyacetone kinase n=1 Tax=Kwoniella dejecticola CBS 10117 TaxID=1296121 RepID=A0A1A6AGE8_9TREE|nr:dihydroxyacetone kinase [Kwoniella dejecticola CBS 10117]OBR89149.1 dihydroxyacetone kinase [Kwoniella dejecticola CBS 10117]